MSEELCSKDGQAGAALLEALIAILIFSFGVLGIVALQATMIKHAAEAKYRADASFVAQQRLGQMWVDPDNVVTYLEDNTDISGVLPSGKRTVVQPVPGQFVVTVTWQQPGESIHTFSTTASIQGG